MKPKLVFIGLIVSFFLFSCSGDLDGIDLGRETSSSELNVLRGNLNDFPEIEQLYQKSVSDHKSLNESGKGGLYDFQIDSTVVSKIIYENDEYYSFAIFREDVEEDNFENLIIANKAGLDPKAFILKYYPDEDFLSRTASDPFTYFSGRQSIQPINYERLTSNGGCFTVTEVRCSSDSHPYPTPLAGPGCTQPYTVSYVVCLDVGDSSSGGGDSGSYSGGGGSGSGSSGSLGSTDDSQGDLTSDVITEPLFLKSINPHVYLINQWGIAYSSTEANYLRNNPDFQYLLGLFYEKNPKHKIFENTKEFIKWNIDFDNDTPCGAYHDCVKSIQAMANGLRKFHGSEGALMADYFDSLVEDFDSFTKSDLQEFFNTAKNITKKYNDFMFASITGAYLEGVTPILEIALFETGLPVAIKLFQKIPVSWVYRGLRLDNVIRKVSQIGQAGSQAHVRIVNTSSPITKSKELFNSLTKHAISKSTNAEGTIIANMGNGNYITYRTVSSTGYPATINFNFQQVLGTNNFVIKFGL
ncbi:hypothetical protein OZ410_06460 [Robiginitalea sp. M366]|uniref:hypothetical protein n=1 Tax=Robiginitalea aestuariiviva TaxID=3036903 RepID=UPI00240D4736|nr:hypothetical protein [Robiginitalea aestuariiviva]MDG1571952.1 hypothetical protein [Robiginitalea aestuariiviva]